MELVCGRPLIRNNDTNDLRTCRFGENMSPNWDLVAGKDSDLSILNAPDGRSDERV
jgi:hypothetical protein